jgi:hypothetical protein
VGQEKSYRPGGFILHPGVVAVVLVGVAVWLGLFFLGESTHGVVGVVIAVLLVVLGLWLGWFFLMVIVLEGVGMTLRQFDRDWRKGRRSPRGGAAGWHETKYLWLAVFVPALLAALVIGFAYGYLAGGVFWGLYSAVAAVGVAGYAEYLMWRASRDRR